MLVLPIKKKWFDMILSGEKKEEYREIKPYWKTRFKNVFDMAPYSFIPVGNRVAQVKFQNGYGKDAPSFIAECTLDIKNGKEKWGAEKGVDYYVLHIENIILQNA